MNRLSVRSVCEYILTYVDTCWCAFKVVFSELKNIPERCCSHSASKIFVHVQRSSTFAKELSMRSGFDNGSLAQRWYSSNQIVVFERIKNSY